MFLSHASFGYFSSPFSPSPWPQPPPPHTGRRGRRGLVSTSRTSPTGQHVWLREQEAAETFLAPWELGWRLDSHSSLPTSAHSWVFFCQAGCKSALGSIQVTCGIKNTHVVMFYTFSILIWCKSVFSGVALSEPLNSCFRCALKSTMTPELTDQFRFPCSGSFTKKQKRHCDHNCSRNMLRVIDCWFTDSLFYLSAHHTISHFPFRTLLQPSQSPAHTFLILQAGFPLALNPRASGIQTSSAPSLPFSSAWSLFFFLFLLPSLYW